MFNRFKNIFLITGTYIATLVGAGFASGQEILSFFIRYGNKSIFAVIGCSIIFGLVAYAILKKCHEKKIQNFRMYLQEIIPKPFVGLVEFIVFLFMATSFCVMAAGCGATLNQICGLDIMYGVMIMCVVCAVCFMYDMRMLLLLNGLMAPIIIIGIIVICYNILVYREITVFSGLIEKLTNNWIMSGLSYTSYNLLTAVAILVGASDKIKNNNDAKWVGFFSSTFFMCMMVLVWVVIKIYYGKIPLDDIPMLTIVSRQGLLFKSMYTIIFMLAIFSTALSNGFAVVEKVGEVIKVKRKLVGFLVCAIGFFGAGVGFEKLVGSGYNICGYVGMALLLGILWDFIVNLRKK